MRYALFAFILASAGTASAQFENGGFEDLNDVGLPAYWQGNLALWNVWTDTLGGFHSDSVVFDGGGNYHLNTTDVHSGQRAIELHNGYNYTQGIPYVGTWSASSESSAYGGFPLVFIGVQQQPLSVEFYAKFQPAGGDSAQAAITVYDDALNEIGAGVLALSEAAPTYTAFHLPVTYTSAVPAAFFSLSFATTRPGGQMTLGTRLLVDDVALVQAVGVDEVTGGDPGLRLYPNPAQERVTLRMAEGERILALRLLDVAGQELPVVRQADGTMACDHLADGLYVVAVRTSDGDHRARLVVRH